MIGKVLKECLTTVHTFPNCLVVIHIQQMSFHYFLNSTVYRTARKLLAACTNVHILVIIHMYIHFHNRVCSLVVSYSSKNLFRRYKNFRHSIQWIVMVCTCVHVLVSYGTCSHVHSICVVCTCTCDIRTYTYVHSTCLCALYTSTCKWIVHVVTYMCSRVCILCE